jgi:ATP-dependent DNA ligase
MSQRKNSTGCASRCISVLGRVRLLVLVRVQLLIPVLVRVRVGTGSGSGAGSGAGSGTGSGAGQVPGQDEDPDSGQISVQLFSRDLSDVTGSFPDVAAQLQEAMASPVSTRNRQPFVSASGQPGTLQSGEQQSGMQQADVQQSAVRQPDTVEAVLDGELCVLENGRIQPLQRLQRRFGVKKPYEKLLAEHPVRFIAYDLLFLDGEEMIDLPLHLRRRRLEEFCARTGLPCSRQHDVASSADIERLFAQALEHGNEGLMLKRRDSLYEFGQRNKSWLKVKKPAGSLDTVIMYAHAGSGRRGGTYSDFTLGIRVDEDERYEEQFIPIGKVSSGYNDEELKKINRRIRELTVERFGPTLSLRPDIVVEVEFDDIQVNRRTKAGFTLRLPRFRAIRWDLSPPDTDTLAEVERLYRLRMEGGGDIDPSKSPLQFQKPDTF